jgi:hypothetical protein
MQNREPGIALKLLQVIASSSAWRIFCSLDVAGSAGSPEAATYLGV